MRHQGAITTAIAREALELLEVDEAGLERLDRELLRAIAEKFDGGPVGLDTLAASLGEEPDTIEYVYEPYLLQLGFIQRTPRGRTITALGRAHLGAPRRATRALLSLASGSGRRGAVAQRLRRAHHRLIEGYRSRTRPSVATSRSSCGRRVPELAMTRRANRTSAS